jgi:ribosome-associated toxin RatA of RatAB toxin-antitoxin module
MAPGNSRNSMSHTPGGRACVRRGVVLAGLAAALVLPAAHAGADPVVVRQEGGAYRVSATFTTPHPAAIVRAVLTDYEQIPRFLPDVRSSRVVERDAERTVVEQEAVAKVLLFSKRVRLLLEVRESAAGIAFTDRGGESFSRYEGSWTLREEPGRTVVVYELVAQPRFEVPDFMLSRLLKRDAERMIERLAGEFAARAARGVSLQSRR